MRLCLAAAILFLLSAFGPAPAFAQPAATTAAEHKEAPRQYSLPPDKLEKAIEYSQARYWLHFVGSIWGIAVLFAILATGLSARFRDWAEAASRRRFVQALVFIPLLALANDVLNLPLEIYGQHLELQVRAIHPELAVVVLGLDQRRTAQLRARDSAGNDSLRGDPPQPAPLVAVLLAGRATRYCSC